MGKLYQWLAKLLGFQNYRFKFGEWFSCQPHHLLKKHLKIIVSNSDQPVQEEDDLKMESAKSESETEKMEESSEESPDSENNATKEKMEDSSEENQDSEITKVHFT